MRSLFSVVILIFGLHAQAFTGVTTENFTSNQQLDTTVTTAVWNIVTNQIQPPMSVCTTGVAPSWPNCFPNNQAYPVDIGTGSDGVFDVPTYANFGTISGSSGNMILTLNTNTHPVFNFTTFNVPSGWTIQGTGSNALWFKVQGSFTNAGTITCQGGNGGNGTSNINVGGAGGIGVCAGVNGGMGGFAGPQTNGANGSDGGGFSGGDVGGGGGVTSNTNANTASGGGGGGTYGAGGTTAGAGFGDTGVPAAGASYNDYQLTYFGPVTFGPGSGSGGGGGGAYIFGGVLNASGGGGGAGGGNIHIACGGAFYQFAGAVISVNGGAGGSVPATSDAGPGGGGGGGTVIIHAGGDYSDYGSVTAFGGANGATGAGNELAGAGGIGRSWITNLTANYNINGGTIENPNYGGPNFGQVEFNTASSYVAQSLGYDTLNTNPTFTTFNMSTSLPSTSTATLTVAGSNDNFVSDNTGFVSPTSVSTLAGKRFFRFNIQIQLVSAGAAAMTPATVTLFNATYNGYQQSNFQFSPACGNFGGPGEFFFDIFLCLFLGLISSGRLRINTLLRRSRNFPSS